MVNNKQNYNTRVPMKKTCIYLLTIISVILLLSSYNEKPTSCKQNDYEICKIDSVKNWYIIYANRNDSTFKIASLNIALLKKEENKCDSVISIGKRYNLSLQKRLENVLSFNSLQLIVHNYLNVQGGATFNPGTDIFVEYEKGEFGLYTCRNLEGLCIK